VAEQGVGGKVDPAFGNRGSGFPPFSPWPAAALHVSSCTSVSSRKPAGPIRAVTLATSPPAIGAWAVNRPGSPAKRIRVKW